MKLGRLYWLGAGLLVVFSFAASKAWEFAQLSPQNQESNEHAAEAIWAIAVLFALPCFGARRDLAIKDGILTLTVGLFWVGKVKSAPLASVTGVEMRKELQSAPKGGKIVVFPAYIQFADGTEWQAKRCYDADGGRRFAQKLGEYLGKPVTDKVVD